MNRLITDEELKWLRENPFDGLAEIERLKSQLEKAEEVIRYYKDIEVVTRYEGKMYEPSLGYAKTINESTFTFENRAKAYFAEREKEIEK